FAILRLQVVPDFFFLFSSFFFSGPSWRLRVVPTLFGSDQSPIRGLHKSNQVKTSKARRRAYYSWGPTCYHRAAYELSVRDLPLACSQGSIRSRHGNHSKESRLESAGQTN